MSQLMPNVVALVTATVTATRAMTTATSATTAPDALMSPLDTVPAIDSELGVHAWMFGSVNTL